MLKIVVIFVAIFVYSECDFISNNIKKCLVKDYDCQLDNLNNFLKEAADKGIPEFNIPIVDPHMIENIELDLSFLKVTLVKGSGRGFRTCNFHNYRLEMEKKAVYVEINCGKYSVESQYKCEKTPLLSSLIGDIDVHGEGTGRITFENKRESVDLVFETKTFDDGELHVVIIPDKMKLGFLGADNITAALDNFYIGSQEISGILVNIFNENQHVFAQYFYRDAVIGKFKELIAVYLNNFFASVPLKYLIKN